MRRVLAALTAGLAGAALMSGSPVGAVPLPPVYVSNTLSPNPAVFPEDIGLLVEGTVTVREAEAGLVLQDAAVYDPACPYDDPAPETGPPTTLCGEPWLHLVSSQAAGDVRTLTMKGEIPRKDMGGSFVESPHLEVLLTYTHLNDSLTYDFADTGLQIYGASRVSFDPQAGVEPGASFTVTSKAEHVTDDWYPAEGYQVTLQRGLGGDAWEDQETGTTDGAGEVTLTSSPVTEAGDWRVRLDDIESSVVTYSATRRVSLPSPPVVTPTPTPPVVTPTPSPPVVTPPPGVVTRPSAPRRQHTTSASTRATLYWAAPASTGGARIDRYQIRRGTSTYARNLPPTARHFTFTHLRNGSLYRLYVRAHNTKGFSGWVAARARPHAPPRPRDYASCAALNRVYPHGVGRPGARDRGGNVTTFTRSLATYRLNTESDRDHDGIACER
jgi:hypothetical protein